MQIPSFDRQVSMRHLPPGVHPRVSPPSHGEPHSLRQPQHMAQRHRQLALDSPPPRLRRPPGGPASVIGKINPDPNERVPTHADLLTCTRTSFDLKEEPTKYEKRAAHNRGRPASFATTG